MRFPLLLLPRSVVDGLLKLGRELDGAIRDVNRVHYRSLQQEYAMRQTTTELIGIVNELKAINDKLDPAVDKLIEAFENEDEAELQAAIDTLKSIRDTNKENVDKLPAAVVEVAKAEPDHEASETTSVDNTNGNPGA